MTIPDRRLSTAEVQDLMRPLENDLIAYYRLLSDAAEDLLDKAVKEGWTPEQLIDELDRMIGGDNRAAETQAVPALEDLRVNKAQEWLTLNAGDGKGTHVKTEDGKIIAGAGGKLTGKHLSEISGKKKQNQETSNMLEVAYNTGGKNVDSFLDRIRSKLSGNTGLQESLLRKWGIDKDQPKEKITEQIRSAAQREFSEQRKAKAARQEDSRKKQTESTVRDIMQMAEEMERQMQNEISAQDKKEAGKSLVAKGEGMPNTDAQRKFVEAARSLGVDPSEFFTGIITESKEHSVSLAEGAKIALDHLRKEDPKYYTKLQAAGL